MHQSNRCEDTKGNDFHHTMDTTKIGKLGLTHFIGIEQMFDDILKSFHETGLIGDYLQEQGSSHEWEVTTWNYVIVTSHFGEESTLLTTSPCSAFCTCVLLHH